MDLKSLLNMIREYARTTSVRPRLPRRRVRSGKLISGIRLRGLRLTFPWIVVVHVLLPAAVHAAEISGKVFEDVNYGGGAGRNWIAASAEGGSARAGARVELFDSTGAFVSAVTTDASGNYSFLGLPTFSYTVRVVTGSMTSSRTGYIAGLLPVLTFRTNASTGAAVDVTNFVGGHDPLTPDAGNAAAGWTLNTGTGVFSGSGSGKAHAFAAVTSGILPLNGVDFGWNFDTIVNTNDTGQGSLRQFLSNANALGGEASLAQSGNRSDINDTTQSLPGGYESSIFMISDGNAHAGLRAGIANQLSGGVAVITPATALTAITGPSTAVDGTTQTVNVGNSNALLLGTGGAVGVDGLALSTVPGPELQITGSGTLANGLVIQANGAIVRGLAIHGFGTASPDAAVQVNAATGALIESNLLGSRAASFTDPGAVQRNQSGVAAVGASGGTVRNNLIGFGRVTGINVIAGSTGWLLTGNEIRDSGMDTADGDGITVNASTTNTMIGNLLTGSSSQGIVVTGGGASGNAITNNTLTGNGVGITSGLIQSAAVTMRTGVASTTLDRNIVRANYGAGIQVNNGATGTRITQNSFALNGTITARNGGGATGQIGIDLNAPGDDINFGTAPFYTLNDSGDVDAGGNGLRNFPVLVSATTAAGNLILSGYARPGSLIELLIAAPDPSGFGEGETYLLTLTEGGTGSGGNDPYADTDASTGVYGPGAINGIVQGTDNTNGFTFTLPVPGGVGIGTALTATATVSSETSEFSGLVTVALSTLDMVKRAFWPDGTPIPTGATIPSGVEFKYLLYVNNPGGARSDVTVRDALDAAFQYQAGTIQIDNSVGECAAAACTPAEEQTIFSAISGAALQTDAADGDVASYTGASSSVDAGNGNVANLQLDINGNAVWGILFSAKMP